MATPRFAYFTTRAEGGWIDCRRKSNDNGRPRCGIRLRPCQSERSSDARRRASRSKRGGAHPGYGGCAPAFLTESVGYCVDGNPPIWLAIPGRMNSDPVSYSPFHILLVVLLIAVNGFFAAAEVALLSVRHSRLRQMAADGRAGAQAALNLLANPGRLLSVTQVGVTLASLGLGWAGKTRCIGSLRASSIRPATPARRRSCCSGAAFALAVPRHQLLPRGAGRSGAEESGHRQSRPAGGPGGARRCWCSTASRFAFVVVIERSAGVITRALGLAAPAPRRRPLGRGTEADRQLQPRPGLPSRSPGRYDPPRARSRCRLGTRDHGAAQRHRLHRLPALARRRAPHHDRNQPFAPARLRGFAGENRRHPALQRSAAGVGGAAPRHPFRTPQPLVSRHAAHFARTWSRPKPNRSRRCSRSSARAARTWPWWWTSSAPSSEC